MLNCYVQMIKYWHHIKTAYSKDSLVYKVINYMENNDKQEQYKWLSTVKFILELCELDYVWKDPQGRIQTVAPGFRKPVRFFSNCLYNSYFL